MTSPRGVKKGQTSDGPSTCLQKTEKVAPNGRYYDYDDWLVLYYDGFYHHCHYVLSQISSGHSKHKKTEVVGAQAHTQTNIHPETGCSDTQVWLHHCHVKRM